jgi:hypothetical protein
MVEQIGKKFVMIPVKLLVIIQRNFFLYYYWVELCNCLVPLGTTLINRVTLSVVPSGTRENKKDNS